MVKTIVNYATLYKKVVIVIVNEADYSFFMRMHLKESTFSVLVKQASSYVILSLFLWLRDLLKENWVYGNRIASLTFGMPTKLATILEEKSAELIRSYSCTVCKTAQLATLRCLKSSSKKQWI